jgi:hypothetical protein
MTTAGQAKVPAVHVVVCQVKKLSGHRQRLTADSARVTQPVDGNGQAPGPDMLSGVHGGTGTP